MRISAWFDRVALDLRHSLRGDFFGTLRVPAFAGQMLTTDDDRRGPGEGGLRGIVASRT